jgi:hypothetical protein
MSVQDANLIKERIINFLERNGPSLPVHIGRSVGMDMIFTSAFLSELISNQKMKVSKMKVGTSPVYFIPGQEAGLQKFKGKEKEAFLKLKKEKFIEAENEEPAIKVALQNIPDFAKSFEKNGKVIWRFFLENEDDFKKTEEKKETKNEKEAPKKVDEKVPEEKEEEIKDKKPAPVKKKKVSKTTKKKKSTKNEDDKFFNKVKEYLSKNNWEILDIVSFNKKDLILKVKSEESEKLIVAYNKKKISEKEILNAHKKALENSLPYSVISLGEAPKKTKDILEAARKLDSVEKIE